jgi:hypothetical protein
MVMPARENSASILGKFINYEENEVLQIQSLGSFKLRFELATHTKSLIGSLALRDRIHNNLFPS